MRRLAVVLLVAVVLVAPCGVFGESSATGPAAVPVGEGALFTVPSPAGDLSYVPGRGLSVGDTGFGLGGYTSVNLVRDEGRRTRLGADDVSLFVRAAPVSWLSAFSELEVEDLVEVDDSGRVTTAERDFIVERLYGDLSLNDTVNLRLGKFLTPVGRWNLIHAQPLVWTTSRPLSTSVPFVHHTTGAMLFGSIFSDAGIFSYSLFGQMIDAFASGPEIQSADRSAGARLEFAPGPSLSVGATYFAFRDAGDWHHLAGADLLARAMGVEWMGEFTFEAVDGAPASQWGGYLQGVRELVHHTYFVLRYEHFAQRSPVAGVNLADVGFAYRPVPFAIVKVEYQFADRVSGEAIPGFKSSFALLF